MTTVRDVRAALGLSQRLFARRLGVRVATVNRWERGLAEPSRLAWLAMRGLDVPGLKDQISHLLERSGYRGGVP